MPFVSRRALGLVCGAVGAGGNLGSAVLQVGRTLHAVITSSSHILYVSHHHLRRPKHILFNASWRAGIRSETGMKLKRAWRTTPVLSHRRRSSPRG